jgi:Spy/CpxP family protein refolding chaperone
MKMNQLVTACGLAVALLCSGGTVIAQNNGGGGGGGGGRGMRGGVLTQDQNQQIRDAVTAEPEFAALNTKLAAAQKAAVDAALAPDATDASIRAKVAAVAAIQTDIAVLRYTKAVKPVVSTITADQKTQIDAAPAMTYGQFFGGFGGFGGRRPGGGGGGAGGAGGGAGN